MSVSEQEQLARFTPALDALERYAMAIDPVSGFHSLVDMAVDMFDEGERVVLLDADGTYQITIRGTEQAIETPDRLVLESPTLGDTAYCVGDLRRQLHNAVVAPEVGS